MLKRSLILSAPLVAALAGFGAAQVQAASAQPNLSGSYRCGPDAKACQWSGATFTVMQTGNHLDIKNDKGDVGTATLTSNISLSAGPPWNMLGVLSPDNRIIDWSNGTQWQKL